MIQIKQGWFTYAYCHGSEVRQFRAAPPPWPPLPGGYVPAIDATVSSSPDPSSSALSVRDEELIPRISFGVPLQLTYAFQYDDYTLGVRLLLPHLHSLKPLADCFDVARSFIFPSSQRAAADINADQNLPPIALGRGAGQRYLVQRWGGGTVCDKTGRGREIEVQVSSVFLLFSGTRQSRCKYSRHLLTIQSISSFTAR